MMESGLASSSTSSLSTLNRKVDEVTDCFLVITHPYKLLTILFMPSRRCTSPDIRRHCYFSAGKNTKLLKKTGRSLSKDLFSFTCSDSACPLYRLIQASENQELSSDPVLSCFSYMHENCKMVDNTLLFERLTVSYVKDLKIGTRNCSLKRTTNCP